jgi:DeoR family transcriptional regulator, fructose operon transcriptional repressor
VYAEERRQAIVDRAREDGRVEVLALAADLDVTPETIRRDLTELERRGALRRVHGGAIPTDRFVGEMPLSARAGEMAAEKRRIAKAALDLVPDHGTVLLDAGSTTQELATLFPERDLTVITNGLPVATQLAARPHLTVHLVGGRVRGQTMAAVDAWAVRILDDLRVDVAFVATNGLTAQRGLSTHDTSEAQVKAAMIDAAQRVVLLADHTKVGVERLVRYAPLDRVDVLVTDSGLDPELAEELAAAGPRVVCA